MDCLVSVGDSDTVISYGYPPFVADGAQSSMRRIMLLGWALERASESWGVVVVPDNRQQPV